MVASDFNAAEIAELSDDAIVDTLMLELLPQVVPAFGRPGLYAESVDTRRPYHCSQAAPPAPPPGNLPGNRGLRR